MHNKICFFNTTPTWGGGEKWHFDFSSYLVAKGYNVVFVLSPNSELDKRIGNKHGYTVYRIQVNQFSFLNIRKRKQVQQFFLDEQITHLLINSSEDLKIAAPIAKSVGVKKIIYRRGSAIPIKNSFSNRYLFGKVITHIIANSQSTKDTILARNPNLFPTSNIKIIYNGLPTNIVDDGNRIYTKENDEVILGNAGRLSGQKGQQMLLEMALILKNKGINFKLLIAGSGKLLQDLQTFIQKNKLEKEVKLLGFIEDMQTFMRSIDIFVLSSKWEGFGYVTAEALLYEKPVVAYNISSTPEIVINEESGYTVPAFDIEEFTAKVQLLINDPSLRERMGSYGQQFVKDNFDMDQQFQKTEDFVLA